MGLEEKEIAEYLIEHLPGVVCALKNKYCEKDMGSLTLQQKRVLVCLRDKDKSTTEMAEKLGVSLPAISRMTHQLIEKGWVRSSTAKEDKRHVVLQITNHGKKIVESSRDWTFSQLSPILSQLTKSEKQTLKNAFKIINKLTLEDIHEVA